MQNYKLSNNYLKEDEYLNYVINEKEKEDILDMINKSVKHDIP